MQSKEYRKTVRVLPGDSYLKSEDISKPRDAVISVDPNDPRATAFSKKSILSVKSNDDPNDIRTSVISKRSILSVKSDKDPDKIRESVVSGKSVGFDEEDAVPRRSYNSADALRGGDPDNPRQSRKTGQLPSQNYYTNVR